MSGLSFAMSASIGSKASTFGFSGFPQFSLARGGVRVGRLRRSVSMRLLRLLFCCFASLSMCSTVWLFIDDVS